MAGVRRGCRRSGLVIVAALLAGIVCVVSGAAESAGAEADTLGTSPTLSGLSGLVVTESARTLAPWTVSIGADALYAHLHSPSADQEEGRLAVGLGLPHQMEAAALLPAVRTENGSMTSELPPTGTGVGDLQLAAKWRALHEDAALWPTLAVAAVVTLPTGETSKGLRSVDDYGVEVKVISSADLDFSPMRYGLGLYGNLGYFFQDLGRSTAEKHFTYAGGVALPLVMHAGSPLTSPLQCLVEVNGTYLRGDNQDVMTVTPSLRYAGLVTLTAGFQYSVFFHSTLDGAIGAVAQVAYSFR